MVAISLCTLLMLQLSACIGSTSTSGSTPTASAPVTLTYWYTEGISETSLILSQIQAFEQQNPNIKISAQLVPYGEAQARFATAAQAGKAPDVLRSDVDWATQFASLRYLLPIDQYVSQSDLSDYLAFALNYDRYNGHLYGLPQVTNFLALMYNKSKLAKAGITSPPTTSRWSPWWSW